MKFPYLTWLHVGICGCLALSFTERAGAWATGSDSEITGTGLAHQWAVQEGWKLFQYQFGSSEIDNYIGGVTEFPPGSAADLNSTVIEGVYDEDVVGQNPMGYDTVLNHPSLRHFWAPRSTGGLLGSGDYSRNFDEGLGVLGSGAIGLSYDSAPNYAIKYFTGGIGFTGKTDSDWGSGGAQGAVAGKGIRDYYLGNGVEQNKQLAYYWFGHVVHLMEDMAVPAHALGDPHLESEFPALNDPDPVHDWVDGKAFSTEGVGGLPHADFNDTNPTRYTLWGFQSGSGAVGRSGVPESMLSAPLLSPQQMRSLYVAGSFAPETMKSVPAGFRNDVLPLYLLFTETARQAALYDSKDVNGQLDQGSRRSGTNIMDTPLNPYNNWTKSEIEEVADHEYPLAMYSTADAIRYFYSQVDNTPPTLSWLGLPSDELTALQLSLRPEQISLTLLVSLLANDDISGVDQNGFVYHVEKLSGESWSDLGDPMTSSNQATLGAFDEGNYRVWAQVENGAGLTGVSPFGYFNVVPEPSTVALTMVGLLLLGALSRNLIRRSLDPRQLH